MTRRLTRPAALTLLLATGLALAPAAQAGDRHYRSYHGYNHGRHYHGHHHGWNGAPGWAVSLGFALGGLTYAALLPRHDVICAAAPAVHTAPVTYSSYTYASPNTYGSIETEIRPDSAAVYLDGQAVGIADDFNGWPAKLYVTAGRHELVFVERGYHSYRTTVDVLPRHSLKVERHLTPGLDPGEESAQVSQGGPGSTYRRIDPPTYPVPAPAPAPAAPPPAVEVAALTITVEPADASVYIDGVLSGNVGSTRVFELAPGTHFIEAVRPGHHEYRTEVRLGAGETRDVTVRLPER